VCMVNYIIAGGPCTGKSSVIDALESLGYNVLKEAAREVAGSDERFIGKSVNEIDHELFEDAIFDFQKDLFRELGDEVFFADAGIGDSFGYRKFRGVPVGQDLLDLAREIKHDKVFVLDVLDFYENDELRTETREEQKIIHDYIIEAYGELGYDVVFVPVMSVEDRVSFILDKVGDEKSI